MVRYFYLDSSVVLRVLLGHSLTAARWLDEISADESNVLVSSRLLRLEVTRVLRREGLPVTRRDEVLDFLALIPLNDGVLTTAETIVPHVKTLDSIHLGSAIVSGLDLSIVTHDSTMKTAAHILGYPVIDPVEE